MVPQVPTAAWSGKAANFSGSTMTPLPSVRRIKMRHGTSVSLQYQPGLAGGLRNHRMGDYTRQSRVRELNMECWTDPEVVEKVG